MLRSIRSVGVVSAARLNSLPGMRRRGQAGLGGGRDHVSP